jgi:hypothetical protein
MACVFDVVWSTIMSFRLKRMLPHLLSLNLGFSANAFVLALSEITPVGKKGSISNVLAPSAPKLVTRPDYFLSFAKVLADS